MLAKKMRQYGRLEATIFSMQHKYFFGFTLFQSNQLIFIQIVVQGVENILKALRALKAESTRNNVCGPKPYTIYRAHLTLIGKTTVPSRKVHHCRTPTSLPFEVESWCNNSKYRGFDC